MRFPSRLISSARHKAPFVFAFAMMFAALGLNGCEDKHIGRQCELGPGGSIDGGTGSTAIISSPALECPTRICILPGAMKDPGATSSLCTAACSSDDDCTDGETVSATASASPLCKMGFACMVPTTVGPFCCQKLCVCRDFVSEPKGGFPLPEACTSTAGGCANVH
jgi:hypothetical protein